MKLQNILLASVLLVGLRYVAAGGNLFDEYQFSTYLDQDESYALHWSYDLRKQTIDFGLNVSTNGWIGFGISHTGYFAGSDVIIGYVENGQAVFHDRAPTEYASPPIDMRQDWFLVNSEEVQGTNGYTILEFFRPLKSCDKNDLSITGDPIHVIWSYHTLDPPGPNAIPLPEYLGSKYIDLLGPEKVLQESCYV